MAWIKTIPPEDAGGELKREYDSAIQRAGKIYNIVRITSLRPDLLRSWIRLYLKLMHESLSLTRRQCEMIAVVVSAANDCFY